MDSKASGLQMNSIAGISKIKKKLGTSTNMSRLSRRKRIQAKVMIGLYLNGKYKECLEFIRTDTLCNEISKTIMMTACWSFLGINHERTTEILGEIIKSDPGNAFAYYGLGHCFYLRGELEECVEPLSRAYELLPASMTRAMTYKDNSLKILKLISDAKVESAARNFSEGIKLLITASLVDPNNDGIKNRLKNFSEDFVKNFLARLKQHGLGISTDERLNYIKFLVKLNKFDEAAEVVQDDTALDWYLRGFMNYQMGRLKQSLSDFQQALELRSDFHEAKEASRKAEKLVAHLEISTGLMRLRDYDVAAKTMTDAFAVDPENKRIRQAIFFQRAACKFFMGKEDEAFKDYLEFEALQNETGMVMNGVKF